MSDRPEPLDDLLIRAQGDLDQQWAEAATWARDNPTGCRALFDLHQFEDAVSIVQRCVVLALFEAAHRSAQRFHDENQEESD